jgi:hypothetical protein
MLQEIAEFVTGFDRHSELVINKGPTNKGTHVPRGMGLGQTIVD